VPVGNAKTSFIDVRDIGAVAALALTEEGHAGKNYDLTGGEISPLYLGKFGFVLAFGFHLILTFCKS